MPQDKDIKGRDFKIRIYTDEPTIIFDTCAQFGRLKSIKIEGG
jgi:dihydroxyacetone kinase-like predicted kinase